MPIEFSLAVKQSVVFKRGIKKVKRTRESSLKLQEKDWWLSCQRFCLFLLTTKHCMGAGHQFAVQPTCKIMWHWERFSENEINA